MNFASVVFGILAYEVSRAFLIAIDVSCDVHVKFWAFVTVSLATWIYYTQTKRMSYFPKNHNSVFLIRQLSNFVYGVMVFVLTQLTIAVITDSVYWAGLDDWIVAVWTLIGTILPISLIAAIHIPSSSSKSLFMGTESLIFGDVMID